MMLKLSWNDVRARASVVLSQMRASHLPTPRPKVYPVPRGGIYAALLLGECVEVVEHFERADCCIDDIIDTGKTKEQFLDKPFFALVDKLTEQLDGWVEFPWERMSNEQGPEESIRRIIEFIGDDPNREGLLKTPQRVVRSYSELFSGYGKEPADVITVFEDGACDEMVIVRGVEFVSFCEHHMLPFIGTAHIAYVPDKRVIGVSKLVRLLEIYARRLQIQERLCQQVTKALDKHLKPKGSACVVMAKHLCMSCRGVGKQHSEMVTSSLTGSFLKSPEARGELFSLIQGALR